MTVIVILALIALFIGLRLYSVLGERTGHEQQPILKPADPEAVLEPRLAPQATASTGTLDSADLAYLPLAGPGVRALLAADPSFIPNAVPGITATRCSRIRRSASTRGSIVVRTLSRQ